LSRQTRAQQLFFVNGRAIESPVIGSALKEGYHTALMKGQFPVTFLFVELDPAAVDVNVHPAKREVRFRDPAGVREAVVAGIRRTLESDRSSWQEQFRAPAAIDVPFVRPTETLAPFEHVQPSFPVEMREPAVTDKRFVPNEERRPMAEHQFRILGILNKLYVLMENAEGLVLVDQHAAHERILFEELRRRMEEKGVPSQRLLLPQGISTAVIGPIAGRLTDRLESQCGGSSESGRPPFLARLQPAAIKAANVSTGFPFIVISFCLMRNGQSSLRLDYFVRGRPLPI